MRSILLLVAAVATPALAHIKLDAPASFQVTDSLGNPQKVEPCGGAGTASGVVTTVMAGSQLTVTWHETILHPGHFRLAIARNASEFMTPTPVLNMGGTNCASAPIESNPAYPVLADGLFPHTSASPNGYTTTITVPMMSCDNCMLQLMQFMSAHQPPCFYYQCAALKIVMPDAGTPVLDGGVDGGPGPTGGGGGTGGGSGGGATGGGSATGGGGGAGGGTGGGTVGTCGPATCQGCCGADGTCYPGTAEATCGAGGRLCLACTADNACMSGQCAPAPKGCGCGAGPLGALLLLPVFWLSRRRRR